MRLDTYTAPARHHASAESLPLASPFVDGIEVSTVAAEQLVSSITGQSRPSLRGRAKL
jgi:hypothetical protein